MEKEQALIVLFVAVILFLILREIVGWYLKINERVKLSKDILVELKGISKALNNNKPPIINVKNGHKG